MTSRSNYYVYALFRETGMPFYIGKGRGDRWNQHESEARRGKRTHRHNIIRRMLKNGMEIPKIKIYEGLTEAAAHDYEILMIKMIGRYPYGPLLNATDGGEGCSGRVMSRETRVKLSIKNKGQKPSALAIKRSIATHTGRQLSAEHRAKLSLAQRKRPPRSADTRAKLSAAIRRQVFSLESRMKRAAKMRGRRPTAETCAKISAANSGKRKSAEHRAKIAATLRGHEVSPETRAKLSAANKRVHASTRPVIGRKAGLRAATRRQISRSRPLSV